MDKNQIKFLDLFSGIGAFHTAIKNVFYKSKCIAAVDIDDHAKQTYKKNYLKKSEIIFLEDLNDSDVIDRLTSKEISYNFLCAGFPCQPFSKAGSQKGIEHKEGKLFEKVLNVIEIYNKNHCSSKIDVILLENVAYLANHNNKTTWMTMKNKLEQLGYVFLKNKEIIISPIDLNIPQNRKRLFLIAFYKDSLKKNNISESEIENVKQNLIDLKNPSIIKLNAIEYLSKVILNQKELKKNILEDEKQQILNIWDEFIQTTNLQYKTLGFPIWLDFFEMDKKIPEVEKNKFYKWKKEFYLKNQYFYLKNKTNIDRWWNKNKEKLLLKKTYCKFEWNSSGKIEKISDGIVQFRHSGIRVKKPDFFPALVKTSSKPIIWDKKCLKYRYIDVKEALHLQSFDYNNFVFPDGFSNDEPFKRIGNSINVKVLEKILESHKNLIQKLVGLNNEI